MVQATKPKRQNRTITIDFKDETSYFQLLDDGKAFVEFALAFILSLVLLLSVKAVVSHKYVLRQSIRLVLTNQRKKIENNLIAGGF
jgi:hypothetical protein